MAEPRLIEAYLTELRYSVAKLDDADEIVEEVADHLYTALERLTKEGIDMANAESQALGQFGSASLVSQVFAEEAKRGGAVSTTLTRRAGAAAMAASPLIVIGQIGNEATRRGFMDNNSVLHAASLAVLAVGIGAVVLGLWGVRRRHGGLGRPGRILFWWFLASPFIAAPFQWVAPLALGVQWLLITGLLGVAMVRARILPMPAVALFAFSPFAAVLIAWVMSAMDRDAGPWFVPLLAPVALGYAWLGWAMWREPALDVRSGNSGTPFAAA